MSTQDTPPLRPKYRLPWRIFLSLSLSLAMGRPRDFLADCQAMLGQLDPPARVRGVEHIPRQGPFLLIANHYQRLDCWIGWAGALLTSAVAARRVDPGSVPLHFLVQSDLHSGRVPIPGAGWAFARMARIWGMVPMPEQAGGPRRRALAVRALEALAFPPPRGRAEPVALFPEGTQGRAAGLRAALPGTGALFLAFARAGVPVVPAGVHDLDGRLEARFGPALHFGPPARGRERAAAADRARDMAMLALARLLPEALRGLYSDPHPDPLPLGEGVAPRPGTPPPRRGEGAGGRGPRREGR